MVGITWHFDNSTISKMWECTTDTTLNTHNFTVSELGGQAQTLALAHAAQAHAHALALALAHAAQAHALAQALERCLDREERRSSHEFYSIM